MSCKAAVRTDEYHGWECEITGGACMFLIPNSKACAKEYGEGPGMELYEKVKEYAKRHIDACETWEHGGIRNYIRTGEVIEIEYEDGSWWHYKEMGGELQWW